MWQLSSGAFLGWSIGSNDAANVFGTGVSTQLVSYRTAVTLIAIFVTLGAVFEGERCMITLKDLSKVELEVAFFVTFAAAVVISLMSVLALPASSSQAVVGAVFAIGLVNGSANANVLAKIVTAWILTPVCAGILSILFYNVLGWLLRPLLTSLRWSTPVLRTVIIIAGCYGSYAMGSNNVANVSGVYYNAGLLTSLQASIFGGLAIATGVLTYSKRVMLTVGRGIYAVDGFTAFITVITLAVSSHLFTQIGVPVSSSQAIVGAVIGIGLMKDMKSLSWKTIRNILVGWIVTPAMSGAQCLLSIWVF